MSEETELLAWDAPRRCDYCDTEFKPKRPQDAHQHFCGDNCRKNFFRYGAKLRIVAAVSRILERRIGELEKRIAALENKSSKPVDRKRKPVVIFQPEVN